MDHTARHAHALPATSRANVAAPGSLDRELSIWGAHGGAGTTTLATWLQPARDLGAISDDPHAACPLYIAHRYALVIACRNTAWSAARAVYTVGAVLHAGGHVAALAVVSDGWPEPATATIRFALVESRACQVVRVPFVAGLRPVDDAAAVALPRRALRALGEIAAATGRTFPVR